MNTVIAVITVTLLALCVARAAYVALHRHRNRQARLRSGHLTHLEYLMTLSTRAQAVVDELKTLHATYQAKEDAAVKAAVDAVTASDKAQADEDLSGIEAVLPAPEVDPVADPVVEPPVADPAAEPVQAEGDPTAPTGA